MQRRFFLVVVIFFMGMLPASSQLRVAGMLRDAQTKTPLSFANIGIRHKGLGTVAGENGTFVLQIPTGTEQDTLTFSMVGYSDLDLPMNYFRTHPAAVLELQPKVLSLGEAKVASRPWVEKKFGVKHYNPVIHFTDGSTNQNDIFEIAQLVRLGKHTAKITSVNLYINESSPDSGLFRVNFYAFQNGLPGKRLVEKNILLKKAIREGWMQCDVSAYGLYLKGDVLVAIEFIPSASTGRKILYEVKLGGPTRSFVRASSLGDWHQPPHHYRLHITALTDPDVQESDEDDKETKADLRLYSKAVRDSFSVFIHLPPHYKNDPERDYPVVYVLDGNAYFDALKRFAGKLDREQECIVIGIGYSNAFLADSLRDRDYTYPKALASDSMTQSGGANRFLRFIKEELLPHIEYHYRCDTNHRILMGHSLGGYFVLYALLEDLKAQRPAFHEFVAASPSLWYADRYLESQYKSLVPNANGSANPELYLTLGDEEKEDRPAFNGFIDVLQHQKLPIELETRIFKGHEHMETALPSFEGVFADF